jgi:hypothetical protein
VMFVSDLNLGHGRPAVYEAIFIWLFSAPAHKFRGYTFMQT